MSVFSPKQDWLKGPSGNERLWISLAFVWCLILFFAMPYWHLYGKQNIEGETYKTTPEKFKARVDQFVKQYQQKGEERGGIPVVTPPPGSDIYLYGKMWVWYPILKLKKGKTYRLHISSLDLQHGFSVLPLNMNFQTLPGYDFVLTITPTRAGEYPIICNEFCGIGHHAMTGLIIVEE